jgi:hypothetical protein
MDETGRPQDPQPPAAPTPAPPPPVPPWAPPSVQPAREPPGPNPLTVGWRTALIRGLVAVGVLAALAGVILLIAYLSDPADAPDLGIVLRLAGLLFYSFHRVGMVFDLAGLEIPAEVAPGLPVLSFDLTLALAAMTGTFLLMWLMFLGGKAIGIEAGGTAWVRGLHGMKIALPYAVICFVGAFAVRQTFPLLQVGRIEVHPSYIAAFLWPLMLAAVFAFAGGFRSAGDDVWAIEPWGRRLRGALAGGWRMAVLGLALAFAGFLVLALIQFHVTRAYFEGMFGGGVLSGIALLLLNIMVIPNMAAWVLFPSMGACVGLSGGALSACVLSYTNFPRAPELGGIPSAASPADILPTFPTPGAAWFLFVLVPIVTVVLGGMVAARKAQATSPGEAVFVGALAGVVYGILALAAALLSTIAVKVSGAISALTQTTTIRLGPYLLQGFLFALLWGALGGALGAFIQSRSLSPRTAPAASAWESIGPTVPRPPDEPSS